jgi:uncharacterized protein
MRGSVEAVAITTSGFDGQRTAFRSRRRRAKLKRGYQLLSQEWKNPLHRARFHDMKPSLALDAHREEVRRIVAANRGLNPRVFGSVLHHEDTESSDLDLLIDAADGFTLFDMAAIAVAIESLVHTKVDVRTSEDLSVEFRGKIVAEARPE